jgi:hypothetical protein
LEAYLHPLIFLHLLESFVFLQRDLLILAR